MYLEKLRMQVSHIGTSNSVSHRTVTRTTTNRDDYVMVGSREADIFCAELALVNRRGAGALVKLDRMYERKYRYLNIQANTMWKYSYLVMDPIIVLAPVLVDLRTLASCSGQRERCRCTCDWEMNTTRWFASTHIVVTLSFVMCVPRRYACRSLFFHLIFFTYKVRIQH